MFAFAVAAVLDRIGGTPFWCYNIKRILERFTLGLEKFIVSAILMGVWTIRATCPDTTVIKTLSEYWIINYKIGLKESNRRELWDLILSAMIRYKSDKARSYYIIKLAYHIEELFGLPFYDYVLVIYQLPVTTCWGVFEFSFIRNVGSKMVVEIADALERFKKDGLFCVDACHLVVREYVL